MLIGPSYDPGAFRLDGSKAMTGGLVIPDSGNIGSVSDTDAIQIEADGDVVLTQDLKVTGTINTTEIYNSVGTLKIMPDIQGDVELFSDTDVGNEEDGKHFRIYRKAPEGDNYLDFGISKWGSFLLSYSGGAMGFESTTNPVRLQYGAYHDVWIFDTSIEGRTKELKIYGYRTGDVKRSLEIGVGVDAADTVSFDGLANYWFDGEVDAQTKFKVAGTQVVGARVIDGRCDDAINSGDGTTDGVIDALRDAMITHGLIAAS